MEKIIDYIVKYYEGKDSQPEEMEISYDPMSGRRMAWWLANIKYHELKDNGKAVTATKVRDARWADAANMDVTGYVICEGEKQYIFLVEPSERKATA